MQVHADGERAIKQLCSKTQAGIRAPSIRSGIMHRRLSFRKLKGLHRRSHELLRRWLNRVNDVDCRRTDCRLGVLGLRLRESDFAH